MQFLLLVTSGNYLVSITEFPAWIGSFGLVNNESDLHTLPGVLGVLEVDQTVDAHCPDTIKMAASIVQRAFQAVFPDKSIFADVIECDKLLITISSKFAERVLFRVLFHGNHKVDFEIDYLDDDSIFNLESWIRKSIIAIEGISNFAENLGNGQ